MKESDYSFLDDNVIEREKLISLYDIVPQEGLRYSIINILAYCLGHVINDYMVRFTKNSYSFNEDKICYIVMKNEFLFKRALVVQTAKKNYATIQEIQEGKMVRKSKQLDIKGLMMGKANLTKTTQKALQKIMYEDILNDPNVNQIKVLTELARMETRILQQIRSGSKEYFKPAKIKSMNSYADPMGQQGIKAAVVYNTLRTEGEIINMEEQNYIDIVKLNLNRVNSEKIKDKHPEVYEAVHELFKQKYFAKGITAIAIPKNERVPEWVLDFIDYTTIISDNVSHMPIESLGIYRGRKSNNYTNILKL
ncbi:MAG: family B DNA polymerase [Paraclostridium sp.]